MQKLKTIWPHAAMLLILLVCCFIYYDGYIEPLPFGMHDWAQGDRLALAINFYDRGMDFFRPATQSLFSDAGVVGVEFPAQPYLAAAIAHLFGRGSINIVFRLLDIGIAVTGLYFLFRAVWMETKDFIFSLFVPVFMFCSPVYVFYASNYLPDPAAASVTYIAFYYLLKALRSRQFRPFIWSIALATLATLMKASEVSYLGGILFCSLIISLRRKHFRDAVKVCVSAVIAGLLIWANIHHIQYLNEHYHSTLFLSAFRPFAGWTEFWSFVENNYKSGWIREYIMYAQYPLLALMLGLGAKAFTQQPELRSYGIPVPVFFIGACTVFWLFGKQYEVHDYYFISTFLPLVAYILLLALIAVHYTIRAYPAALPILRIGLLSATIMTFFFADNQVSQRMRMVQAYTMDYSFRWSVGGAELLSSLHIPDSERIVVANEDPPNLSLVYFDRKGYVIPRDWNKDIGGIRDFMNEKSVRTLVMREDFLAANKAKDSTALNSLFVVLAQKEGKAVLQKK